MMGLTMSKREILKTATSTTQASISVLLILGYGAAAELYGLLTPQGEKNISHLGVTLFLPALLFSEIGPHASASNLVNDWIIIVLAIWFQLLSYIAGLGLQKFFKPPQWVIPCLVFNNVTSLPLLLFSSLESHGALDDLVGKGESIGALSRRARNYILIHALVCNLARFLFGPALMSNSRVIQVDHLFTHHETPHPPRSQEGAASSSRDASPQRDDPEQQPFLHHSHSSRNEEPPQSERRKEPPKSVSHRAWNGLKSALNPPLVGGIAAVVVGVIPFLHKLLLSDGAPLAALTDSIETIGKLYTALQMFVLGGQLYAKRGSKADLGSFALIIFWRFIAMPVVSISTVYFLRTHNIITPDPVLDFVLAVVPIGPPAITLAAIAELSNVSSETEGQIDRTLLYSYIVTPLISLPVTAALTVVMKLHGIK